MRCEWRPPASCPRWTRVRLTRSPAASSLCCAWPCWSRCAACSTPYMPDTMLERRLLLAPMFLVAQFALAHWAAGGERPPAPPDLSRFPAGFGEWKQLREDPMAADTAAELGADRVLSRTYVNRSASLLGSVLVLWYQSQRSGNSQPHSPQMCLPGTGWIPDRVLSRTYVNRSASLLGSVLVLWYQSQRSGNSQPHSPQMCLPGTGWI